jgi:hypothetical protein
MNRWYWGATACAVLFVITLVLPAYVNEQGGGVWWWQIGIGWNNVDENGHPRHDNEMNRIRPNRVRTVALWAFGIGTAGLAAAGFLSPPKKRERRTAPPAEGMGPAPHTNP